MFKSRSERRKRGLLVCAESPKQSKLTDYFPTLNEIEVLLKENQKLSRQVVSAMRHDKSTSEDKSPALKGLLKDLYDCAIANYNRNPHGRRYTDTIITMSTLFFVMGGWTLYSILSANLPLPSLTRVQANLHSMEVIREGEFRFKQLRLFLLAKNLPLKIHICEDATNIVARILYHVQTNDCVGFVLPLDDQGLPVVGSYPATSAAVMSSYFSKEKSHSAYAIMAQPLAPNAPSFCVSIFGTNNKFKAKDVHNRWNWMIKAAKEEGIDIVSFSGDGDSRLMKSMRFRTFGQERDHKWEWFHATLKTPVLHFQDFVHLLVKLKSRLLHPSWIAPLGPIFVASRGHIAELIQNVSKDLHELSTSFLNSKDKMNYRSAIKLCQENVTTLMRAKVPHSEGTATYLDMMRDVFSALGDPTLPPLIRVRKMWEWVIFMRIWRNWILQHDDYSLQHNFITSNAYLCMELNAHALIQAIVKFRDAEEPSLFLIWLMNSQPCEAFFRTCRSLSSLNSTVVNFAILELIHRIRRIDFIISACTKLEDKYNFPKYKRAYKKIVSGLQFIAVTLPEDYEINQAVEEAFHSATKRALKLQLIKKPLKKIPPAVIPTIDAKDFHDDNDAETDNDESDDELLVDSDEEEDDSDNDDQQDVMNEENDVAEDIIVASSGPLGLKSFDNANVTPNSPYVKVKDSTGKIAIIRKTSYLWLLSSGDERISSDRLLRVQSKPNPGTNPFSTEPVTAVRQKTVSIGSWCAFTSETNSVIIGRILAFSYLQGHTWTQQHYAGLTAEPEFKSSRKLGCLCSWFTPQKNRMLTPVSMDVQGYYDLAHYICTIPRPLFDGKALKLTCTIKDINVQKK